MVARRTPGLRRDREPCDRPTDCLRRATFAHGQVWPRCYFLRRRATTRAPAPTRRRTAMAAPIPMSRPIEEDVPGSFRSPDAVAEAPVAGSVVGAGSR